MHEQLSTSCNTCTYKYTCTCMYMCMDYTDFCCIFLSVYSQRVSKKVPQK